MIAWLPSVVARVPSGVHAKLLAAFLANVILLIILGAVGLATLNRANQRADDLVKLQRNIAAYQQLQHDSTAQLYSVVSALLVPDEKTLEATLRQLNAFGYDVDRIEFIAKDDVELVGQVREDYEKFLAVVNQVVELIRSGKAAKGRELQLTQASPLAERIERRMNELVNRAQTDIIASVEASHEAYQISRWIVIGFVLGSISLALLLGYAISWSLIEPIKRMDTRLQQIAAGDFSKAVEVENRDELGTLAANLNRMSADLGALYQQIETRNNDLKESAIEKARLFNETKEALERQTATAEVLQVISSSVEDAQPVFEKILRSCNHLFGSSEQGILLVGEDGQLHLGAHRGDARKGLERQFPMPLRDDGPTATAMRERRVLHYPDVLNGAGVPEALHRVAMQMGIGSYSQAMAPMLWEGRGIGVISVTRQPATGFADKELALLKTFADQAAIAIQNARLFRELQERTRELARSVEQLQALGEVGRTVSSTLDLKTMLTTIVSYAVQLSGTDAGSIYEYSEDKLRLRATLKLEDSYVEALRANPVQLGEGAVGRAAATRKPVEIPDIFEEAAYPERLKHMMSSSGFRAVLAVPLLHENHILGALAVLRKRPGAFPAETTELVASFAAQSALAIENARLFRELEDKSREVEAASRHKSEFLANMSHELRTPLNAIIGFSEVLHERMFGDLNPKQAEYIQDIHASGRHLHALIDDILDLSKIEAGRMELELAAFDLPTAIHDALTLVRERANRHEIELKANLDRRLGQFVADERKFKQILLNLLSNALKFTPEGGAITVAAALKNPDVEISIADTGIGIAAADQEIIFEEFRQVQSADGRPREGTGLGLALTRKFVEMHGGRIRVQSEPGRGATFTFTLPIRA